MATLPGIIIKIGADTKNAIDGLNRVNDALGKQTTSSDKWNVVSGKMVAAMAAVGAAAGAMAVKFAVDGVKAAADDEAALAKLAQQMTNMGFASLTDAVASSIDSMQRMYGVSEDKLRPAFSRLLTSTQDVTKSQELLKLAMDISAGTGKNLDTVAQALGKAYDGNTGALGRLGIGIDKATLKTGDLDAITGTLSRRFGGQAETASRTYQGSLNRLTIAFGELQESFGTGFLRALGKADSKTDDFMGTMKNLEPVLDGAGSQLGTWVSDVAKLGGIVLGLKTAFDNWSASLSGPFAFALNGVIEGTLRFLNPLRSLMGLIGAAEETFGIDFPGSANTSASAVSALDKAVASGQVPWQARLQYVNYNNDALDEATDRTDKNTKSVKDSGKEIDRLRIVWAQTAHAISESVDVLDVSISGKAVKISGNLVKAFEDRRDAFKAVVAEQTSIIQNAYKAIEDYSDNVVKSFTEFKLGDFIKVEDDGTVNFLADAFNKWISDKTAIANSLAPLATILPESLTQQVLSMDPSAAKAMIDYFTANPAAAENLSTNLTNLTTTTRTLLADPMANVFATIGNDSATSMIANAKKKIADEADDFRKWVRSHLKSRVTVEVEYVAINTPPVGARAAGGPVDARKPYIVGERGPELFMPNVSGTIVPNNELPMVSGSGAAVGSGGGNFYTINVQAGVGDPRAIGQQVVEYIKKFEKANGSVFVAA